MRTTFDIPDELFKKAKLKAVQEGLPLKEIVTRALEREVSVPLEEAATLRKKRAQRLFAALDKARNKVPVGKFDREKLYDRPMLRRH